MTGIAVDGFGPHALRPTVAMGCPASSHLVLPPVDCLQHSVRSSFPHRGGERAVVLDRQAQ